MAERNHAFELQLTDQRIARHQAAAASRPEVPSTWISLVGAHLERARLAGGVADDLAAQEAMAKAVALAPDAPVVRRTQAQLLQRRHHFAEALALLESLPKPTPADRASMAAIRFELGDYQAAVTQLESLADDPADPATPARLAACLAKLGRFEDAERWYGVGASRYHGRPQWPVAWNHLMLGLMDLERDQLDEALVHYQAADAALPGWWLTQEHIAEIHLLQGHPEAALPIYERVVEETDNPELVGALAETYAALGRTDEAAAALARAKKRFDELLIAQPDLAGTHALEFLLEHDPQRALEVARHNVQLRPNGESKLLLAAALQANGEEAGAASLRAEVADSGWWSAP